MLYDTVFSIADPVKNVDPDTRNQPFTEPDMMPLTI